MVKLIDVDVRPDRGEKFRLEFRLEVDGRPYVIVERIRNAEDVDERITMARYCPEIIVKKV